MEALKYLAWHLIYACDEREIYKKLSSEELDDRKSFVQWVNDCLQNGERIQTVLTQKHLNEISEYLIRTDEHQWRKAYFDFNYHVLIFGNEKLKAKLNALGDFNSEY
ncbi:hypothetical protein MK805_12645 [Shimazuella sp. AN120528]|uniref:hypothetical protein n=1 Tax=Shimazuella soli TaxID=1892854 RepID=UPI001F0E7E57|nr:hypothetical protein [Shimazuella soli]MCH5585792.1 hypothetical protein [Shimazuella soli]